jgi:hypothetical protein
MDLEEFKRISAQAEAETARQLGAKPPFDAGPTSLLAGVAVYIVLELFSAATGTHETSGMVMLVFVLAIAGGTYWALHWRENRWIRTKIENEMRIREYARRSK